MVLRAKAPKRSAILSCARPKTRRKSLARNLPSLLAANAVIVFTDHLPAGKMLSFCEETERRKDAGQWAPPNLNAVHSFWPVAARFELTRRPKLSPQVAPIRASLHRCSLPPFFVHRRDEPTSSLPRHCRRVVVRSRP